MQEISDERHSGGADRAIGAPPRAGHPPHQVDPDPALIVACGQPPQDVSHQPFSHQRDVEARLAARPAGSILKGSVTSFGIVGRLLITVPVLVVSAALVYIGLNYSRAAFHLLFLGWAAGLWMFRDVWRR